MGTAKIGPMTGGSGWRSEAVHELTGIPACDTLKGSDERGDIAQLGERCVRIAEVGGSNPPISTNNRQGTGPGW